MKNLVRFSALLLIFFLASCGEEKKEDPIVVGEEGTLNTIEATEASDGAADAVVAENGVVEVLLTGNDQMQFNLETIEVEEGQIVRLTLRHVGQLDENVMGHNFVLLEEGTNVPEFAQAAAQARANDYIPEGGENVIAHTEMIGGGEEVTIEFEAPAPGTYTFICSFPGHYVQMQGQFIVT